VVSGNHLGTLALLMSQRTRRRQRRSRGSVGKPILLGLAVVLAMVGIAGASAAVWVLDVMASAPSIDTLKPVDSGANSEIFAADGTSLGYVQTDVLREPEDLKEMPRVLRNATISIEDENFWEHDGVDYSAIIRAAVENVEAGFEVEQGASTITQQLVRNLYIEDPEDTIERKLIEAEMAREYEEAYSKKRILEEYLNTAAYGTNDGRTAVGVEAASQVFFNKHVSDINLGEAALLAGLPQAPTDYNPFLNPEGAKERRTQVLDAMVDEGYISEVTAAEAKSDGLGLERGYRYEQRDEQYFFDFVQQELIDKYGLKTVRAGGLKVHTTLDPHLQEVARQSIAAHPVIGAASALVSTETETGKIRAMASSSTYDDSQFNLAAQGVRQPGSAFKPFVLTAAVDQGIDPDSTYYSGPSTITLNPDPYTTWTVSGGGGTMSLRDATANSINTIFAQLALDVGPDNFTEMAAKLGITSPLEGLAAEAIGGLAQCCSVLEMSNAFASIANGGVHHDPTAIERVELRDGEVDEPDSNEGTRAVSDGVAYTVADVMTGTLDSGTAACCDIPCPAAGKTGTTELQSDAWFVGYTPKISTAVWTGNPDMREPLPGYGADLSAPIWHDYMIEAIGNYCEDFPEPENAADLSGFYSSRTVDPDYESDETTSTTTGEDELDPDEDEDKDSGNDGSPSETAPPEDGAPGYDPDLYAPGAGQDPAPPAGDDGGPGGGGPPGGGNAGGGVSP